MAPVSRKRRGIPKRTKKAGANESQPPLILEYYQPIFYLLNEAIRRSSYSIAAPHPIRHSYWKVVPRGEYSSDRARGVINPYRNLLEAELAKILAKHSLAYWLHIHRRLSPSPFLP